MGWYGEFAPYVSVAERKNKAAKQIVKLKKKGYVCQPITIEGRSITNTFWGKAWCENLESYSDYSNRLPRGRSYVKNGFVIDLNMTSGQINAIVCGSSIYTVEITIDKVKTSRWENIVKECAGKIASVIELLQGKFSQAVMQIITDREKGLFPHPKEIKLSCSCPDWADMCKHIAAVLYGVGARLDCKPEELFLLRQIDPAELISKATQNSLTQNTDDLNGPVLGNDDLSSLFGIDIAETTHTVSAPSPLNRGKKSKQPKLKSNNVKSLQKKSKNSKKTTTAKKRKI